MGKTKRYESGACKRKRQKEQKEIVKRLKPITSYGFVQYDERALHNPSASDTEEHLSLQIEESQVNYTKLSEQTAEQPVVIKSTASHELQLGELMSVTSTTSTEISSENGNGVTELTVTSKKLTGGAEKTLNCEIVTPKETVQAHFSLKHLENKANEANELIKNSNIEDTIISTVHATSDFRGNNDVGLWSTLNTEEISFWIEKGPSECQHWDGPFINSKRTYKKQVRFCSRNVFHSTKANGETYPLEWLTYSPTKGKVYCFVCKLFCNQTTSTTALATTGFDDWHHTYLVQTHENSKSHMNYMLTYLTRKQGQTLTSKLEEQIKTEQDYWRHILQRVVAVISLLAERGLAFRGNDETFGSPNNGNFLGLIELIAKFDPFMSAHINQYGSKGSGNLSYLPKTICEELIQLMSNEVREAIVSDIKQANYFSVSVDSTPDVSHVDQLTIIVRYVSPCDGLPVERFLTFCELKDHTGKSMAELILNYFSELKINFDNCRGQSYDNAANMSGKYNGVQGKILERNKFAKFIPCAGHSLNLVGRAAVDSCLDAVNFFGTINELYCFFSACTKRWAVLKKFLPPGSKVPKHLSDTRWEAHAKATAAITESYANIIEALSHIYSDETEKGDNRRQAGNLLQKMEEFEFIFMLHLWTHLLDQFHKVSKTLQSSQISLSTCANIYSSLLQFVSNTRANFDEIEHQAKITLPDVEYKNANRRQRLRKKQNNDGSAPEALDELSSRDRFRISSYIPVMDALEANLDRRATVYRSVAEHFSFLVNLKATREQIHNGVEILMQEYPKDVNLCLVDELIHFHLYVKQAHSEKETFSHQEMYQIIFLEKIQTAFPNVETIFRLFLCLMVTNCTGERSFSRLKRIKNDLRSTMSQDRLSALSILCIESDKLKAIDVNDIIVKFALKKARKKLL